jgi:quercetin dioxygenase-like cupin family protein
LDKNPRERQGQHHSFNHAVLPGTRKAERIMITTASEHQVDKVEQMAGGKGHVIIERLLGAKELDGKCGLYAKVTIEPNCTLGFHEHRGETETYYILSGEGSYNDGEKSYPVKAGDVTFCPDGTGHALDNTGDTDLVFMALIIMK